MRINVHWLEDIGQVSPRSSPRAVRYQLKRLCLAGLQWQGDSGPDYDGAPVFCLHGWLDNASSFGALAPLLNPRRTLTSIDLPGHGYSDHRPPGYPYHLLDYVQDLADLIDTSAGPVHVVGHSLGGIIAVLYAATRPEKLVSLTVIDSLGPYVAGGEDFPSRLAKGISKASVQEPKTMPVYESVAAAEKAREGGSLPLSRFAAQQLVSRNLRQVDGGWSWRTDPRLRNPSLSVLTEEQVLASLQAIAVPVLLLQAENGMLASKERFQRRLAALERVIHKRVPGSHHCHLDGDVTLLSDTIDQFMKQSDPCPSGSAKG